MTDFEFALGLDLFRAKSAADQQAFIEDHLKSLPRIRYGGEPQTEEAYRAVMRSRFFAEMPDDTARMRFLQRLSETRPPFHTLEAANESANAFFVLVSRPEAPALFSVQDDDVRVTNGREMESFAGNRAGQAFGLVTGRLAGNDAFAWVRTLCLPFISYIYDQRLSHEQRGQAETAYRVMGAGMQAIPLG